MTQIEYNGIVIKDVLTHSVDQDVVYDSDGQVDQWYVKTTVTAKFTFHTVDGAGLGYANGNDLAGSVSQALRMLMTNRRRFTMTIGGSALFDVRPGATAEGVQVTGGSTFDVNNGPRPKLAIQEIIGTKVARGTFTIELAVPSCSGYSQLLNLRWWTADDVDGNWYTTRTIHGRLRMSSKDAQPSPHFFRNLVFPPLQKGFKRESMTFTEAPNGLELGFSIKDVEKYRSAPHPATAWRGNHRMVSQVPGATIVESECTVTLEGAHDTPQTQLIALGIRIIDNKLLLKEQLVGTLSGSDNALAQLLFYAIDADLADNEVTVTARIRHTGQGVTGFTFLPQAKGLGQNLPGSISLTETYDPLKWRMLSGPTAPLTTLLISKLQTPCAPAAMLNAGTEGQTTNESPSEDGGDYPVITGDLPPEQSDPGFTPKHQGAPFLSYRMVIQDFHRPGRARIVYGTASSSSDEDESAVIDVHKGLSNRNITVYARRIGSPPDLLDPKDSFTDENGILNTLFNEGTAQRAGEPGGAGDQMFTLQQTLRYHLTNNPNVAKLGTTVPLVPWLKPGFQSNKLPSAIFNINPGGGT